MAEQIVQGADVGAGFQNMRAEKTPMRFDKFRSSTQAAGPVQTGLVGKIVVAGSPTILDLNTPFVFGHFAIANQ
jgi:hypothetical protein